MRKWTTDELAQLKDLRRDYTSGEIALIMNCAVEDVIEMISIQRCCEREVFVAEAPNEHRTNNRWTPEMRKRLAEIFPSASQEELEREFGMSYKRIKARANSLGLHREYRVASEKWAEEEIDTLRENYAKMGINDLKRLFPRRTKVSIQLQAQRLKLRKKAPKWTEEEQEFLRQRYAIGTWEEILAALPQRTKGSILVHACKLGLIRENHE